jgi:hypothetical protein
MPKRPKKQPDVASEQTQGKLPPDMAEVAYRTWELHGAPARVSAIIWGATVQERLQRALKARLIRDESHIRLLTQFDGPLGNFNMMHDLAHAVGLISDDIWNDLNEVREIRNKFAHWVPNRDKEQTLDIMSFETPEIKKRAGRLKCPDRLMKPDYSVERVEKWRMEGAKLPTPKLPIPTDPRIRFEWTCEVLSEILSTMSQFGPVFEHSGTSEAQDAAGRILSNWKPTGDPVDYAVPARPS